MNWLIVGAVVLILGGELALFFLTAFVDRSLVPSKTTLERRVKTALLTIVLGALIALGIWGPFNPVFVVVLGGILAMMLTVRLLLTPRPGDTDEA